MKACAIFVLMVVVVLAPMIEAYAFWCSDVRNCVMRAFDRKLRCEQACDREHGQGSKADQCREECDRKAQDAKDACCEDAGWFCRWLWCQ